MRISVELLATGMLCLLPSASIAQDVVPYPKSEVNVDWVRGTDFSKYKTYAWGKSRPTPDQKHLTEDIEGVLQTKGLQKVGMDASPSLIVVSSTGTKLVYSIQGYPTKPVINQGTLVVQLADAQLKKAVWWGIAVDTFTANPAKDIPVIQKRVSKMFEQYPPPAKK